MFECVLSIELLWRLERQETSDNVAARERERERGRRRETYRMH